MPFHLGPKYSSMMAHSRWLKSAAPEGISVLDGGVTPHEAVTLWMRREAARHSELQGKEIGVVVHAHGSDFHWNETMRRAAAPLAEDYPVEYAFSMGNPVTLERAIRRLEDRGVKAVVIVRVFGMADSFLSGIKRFIGADYERCEIPSHDEHDHHGDSPRLLTGLPVTTVGGLEDHRYFALALLDRARVLSQEPSRQTVILVAHGKGDDDGNDRWLEVLQSLRKKMLAGGGDAFRAIEVSSWREDWPEKRDAAVARVRDLIEAAQRDGGRAILVPARTTEEGPARELVPDLEYALTKGFAPHPLFVEWLREQVAQGVAALTYSGAAPGECGPATSEQ